MKSLTICIGALLMTFIVKSQPLLTLQEIQATIKEQHPSLKMLDAEATAMQEAAKGAYSWMPPELGVGFFQTPYNPKYWERMNNQNGMGSIMFSVQQMFPNKKKQNAEFEFMNAQSSIEVLKKDVVENQLIYTARKNYYDWLVILKKLKVLDENEKLLNFMMESAEIRYKNGLGKLNAYYKTKAALSNVKNTQLLLQNEITQKRIAINTLMYRNPDIEFNVDTNIVWEEFNSSMIDSTHLMEQISDIKVLDKNLEINALESRAELAKLKPEWGVQFNHMLGWGGQPQMFSGMLMIKLPGMKWSSKMAKAKVESIHWQNEAIKNQQQMIVNEALGIAETSFTKLDLKKKQMQLYENQIIPALRKNFQTMQLGYEQNTEELFELFDAWEALNMTQLEYLDRLQEALQMQAELMKILEIN